MKMKTLLKLLLVLLTTQLVNAQSFANHYTKVIRYNSSEMKIDKVSHDPALDVDVLTIFSGDSMSDIILCYDLYKSKTTKNVRILRFYKISGIITDDETNSRYINVINEVGSKVIIQLFKDDTLMVHYLNEDYTLKFLK